MFYCWFSNYIYVCRCAKISRFYLTGCVGTVHAKCGWKSFVTRNWVPANQHQHRYVSRNYLTQAVVINSCSHVIQNCNLTQNLNTISVYSLWEPPPPPAIKSVKKCCYFIYTKLSARKCKTETAKHWTKQLKNKSLPTFEMCQILLEWIIRALKCTSGLVRTQTTNSSLMIISKTLNVCAMDFWLLCSSPSQLLRLDFSL